MNALAPLIASSRTVVRRSWLGATFITATALPLIVSLVGRTLKPTQAAVLFPLVVLGSIVIAHIGYEFVLPLQRRLSVGPVEKGFLEVAGHLPGSEKIDNNYLRSWTDTFLGSRAPTRLKQELEKNLHFRQTLSYLTGACVMWLSILILLVAFVAVPQGFERVLSIELGATAFVLFVVVFAHRNRAHALGRSYGEAYLHVHSKEK